MKRLTHRQELALRALLEGEQVQGAAQAAGCATRTLFRWLQDQRFTDRLRELQSAALSEALARLQGASGQAVSALLANLTDGNAWVRLTAATAILDRATKSRELDLEERIRRLEVWSSEGDRHYGNEGKITSGRFGSRT